MDNQVQNPEPIKPSNFEGVIFSVQVSKLKTKNIEGYANAVVGVDWILVALSDEQTYTSSHELSFSELEIAGKNDFTPFSELTEAQVMLWIEERVPMKHMKYSLCNLMQQPANIEQPLPWALEGA